MNENLNLLEILKDCSEGTKLYSPVSGEVNFVKINIMNGHYPIQVETEDRFFFFTSQGKLYNASQGECVLFPSKDQRDWSKFKAIKPKFDTNTLILYMKVLVRDKQAQCWRCSFFSHKNRNTDPSSHTYKYATPDNSYKYCIPYNDDTKHLVGTTEEAPEYYRYWED